MKYIHNLNIIHFDLKAGNILLDENLYPKLSDFGVLRDISSDEGEIDSLSTFRGTQTHAAPEFLTTSQQLTKACDIYSFGVTVFEIITAEKPFSQLHLLASVYTEVYISGNRPTSKYPIAQRYKKLMENCWK